MADGKLSDMRRWFLRMRTGIEIGPTGQNDEDEIFMSRATGKEMVDNLVTAKVDYAVIFIKDYLFAYYDSRAALRAPSLGGRDLLRECVDEAKEHDLPIVAYCQVQYDVPSCEAHPEWRMVAADGKDVPGRLCYTSDYVEAVKQFAAEMMEYEIAGFHFDMLDFGFGPPYGCWCARCRQLFTEKYGIDMPDGVTWDEAWDKMLEFRADSNAQFERELTEFVRSRRPDVAVDFNYHGYPPFDWQVGQRPVQHAIIGDFVTAEGLPWAFGHMIPSLISVFMQGTNPGVPFQGVTSRFVRTYHDYTLRSVADMKSEVFTYLAHGGMCTIVDKINYDGTLDRVAYERMGEVFGEARQKGEYFGHQPIQEVGLYFSSRSRDWYGREDYRTARYHKAFSGAHKALLEAHINMGVILDESVSAERLAEFPVVYLPNTTILSLGEVELLSDYVRDGGKLLATGLTGLYLGLGQPQDTCSLAELIGAEFVEQVEPTDSYLALPSELPAAMFSPGQSW